MDIVMCMAGEIGKIVVNKCLERSIFINTQKLQKLLVLMQIEYITLLEEQEKTVDHVLNIYGDMDALDINELSAIQSLVSKSLSIDGRRVIPSNIMLGFYL